MPPDIKLSCIARKSLEPTTMTSPHRSIAILFPADAAQGFATDLSQSRFAATAAALSRAGLDVVDTPYSDAYVDQLGLSVSRAGTGASRCRDGSAAQSKTMNPRRRRRGVISRQRKVRRRPSPESEVVRQALRCRFSRRSRWHHRPRCRGIERCSRSSNVQAVGLHKTLLLSY